MTTTDTPQTFERFGPKLFMRRAGLIEWLASYGFKPGQVDQLIRDRVIPQSHFPTAADAKKRRSPRAYYQRDAVAAALKIPISTNTPN